MLSLSSLSRFHCILALLCTCSFAIPAHAQSTEAELNSRLMGKPLYLRGFWRDDNLHFDSTGHLLGTSGPVTFTLSGFDLKKIHLKQNKLILEGHRVGLELANDKQKRVTLQVGDPHQPEDESLHIEIDTDPAGNYGPALDAIFVEGITDLVPSLPFYWKKYAQKNFLPAVAASTTQTTSTTSTSAEKTVPPQETRPGRVGSGIAAPRLLHAQEPEFNSTARMLKYSGIVLANLYVEPDGSVSHLSIVRPLGLGLDERALAAIQHYTFSPATEAGKPVLVELNVEVNFQIY
jgi:TonB family protein